MPRTGKGGKREGASQTSYANRTDLNNRGPQPITIAPGQAYGEAKMQEDAQRAVPMSAIQIPQASPTPNPPTVQNLPKPGTIPFDHPTERPDEPVTSGISAGAGPGPEALGTSPNAQHSSLQAILEAATRQPGVTPQVRALADFARMFDL